MSTIASPRDPSSLPRRTHSSQNIITTPTSSTRPSMDATGSAPLSTQSSPIPSSSVLPSSAAAPTKRNRAALREYYNLKKAASVAAPGTPTLEITPSADDGNGNGNDDFPNSHSEIPSSELDSPDFDAEGYVRNALKSRSLEELLRLYARVLGEMRALDAEKKALVYDNYSKLIAATETIRRMRMNMDPLNPVASTLDPAVGRVYEMARGCREDVKRLIEESGRDEGRERIERRTRTRDVVRTVLGTPERMRELVREGAGEEEVRKVWEVPRRLLVRWKEDGVGGGDVDAVLREGDEIVRGIEEGDGSGSGSASASGEE